MVNQFGSTDQYATSAMLDVAQAREAPGKNNRGRAFAAEQTALLRKYREYVMGKAYSPEHQAEIEEVIAKIEGTEHMAPPDLVVAMRGLYRAAHAGFAIRMIQYEERRYIEVSKVVTSPWGLYDLGECE